MFHGQMHMLCVCTCMKIAGIIALISAVLSDATTIIHLSLIMEEEGDKEEGSRSYANCGLDMTSYLYMTHSD